MGRRRKKKDKEMPVRCGVIVEGHKEQPDTVPKRGEDRGTWLRLERGRELLLFFFRALFFLFYCCRGTSLALQAATPCMLYPPSPCKCGAGGTVGKKPAVKLRCRADFLGLEAWGLGGGLGLAGLAPAQGSTLGLQLKRNARQKATQEKKLM